jgi:hypothetical protein
MAEEAKMEVAPPAPEPAKDIAEEKALVVAEGTSVCSMVRSGETLVRCVN